MGFDVKRAESISSGFKEWIHTGRMSYDNAVKQIKETYREDMAREIVRILDRDIKEVIEKCRWALVFEDVEEAERARERLSGHNIYPDSQEENKLLWADKEEAEYAREHVGGLIEPWTPMARPGSPSEKTQSPLSGQPTSWDEEKLKEQNRVCKVIENWLDAKGIPYKSDVGFIEFPRPGLPKGKFQKLVREAEQKFTELDISKTGAYYDVFETTIIVDFPEQKKWFNATFR